MLQQVFFFFFKYFLLLGHGTGHPELGIVFSRDWSVAYMHEYVSEVRLGHSLKALIGRQKAKDKMHGIWKILTHFKVNGMKF